MTETLSLHEDQEALRSNLSPELHELVRTPEFKDWFGDWENPSDDASKMVDKNGEPQVYYFGGRPGITQFEEGHREWTGQNEVGFYSTSRKKQAQAFAQRVHDPITDKPAPASVYSLFLNIRNPYYPQKGDGVLSTEVHEMPEGCDGIVNEKLKEVVIARPDQAWIVLEEPLDRAPHQ